jgi:chemotaxis response regulator CheB
MSEAGERWRREPGSSKSAISPKKPSKRKDVAARKRAFPVVAIGASAGGLEAYKEFFHALPSDTGMAFVLSQHLDPRGGCEFFRALRFLLFN